MTLYEPILLRHFSMKLTQFDQRFFLYKGAKNFTNYVFCHPQFNSVGVIQNIENRCAILTLFVNVD